MVNPQLKNGYTKIANEILEKLAQTYLAPNQTRVLMFIIRKTYGWEKKRDFISLDQFVVGTGLLKPNISRALSELIKRKIIIRADNRTYGLQKDWTKWKVIIRTDKIINTDKTVINTDKSLINTDKNEMSKASVGKRKRAPKETLTKETYTKEMILSQIDKLKSQFPQDIQPLVMEYIELVKAENKTGRITDSRRKRILEKLHSIYCEQTEPNEFKAALEITVNNEAPHPNYIKKVLKTRQERVNTQKEKNDLRKKVERQRARGELKKIEEYEKVAVVNEEGKKRAEAMTRKLAGKMGIEKQRSPP